MAERDQHNRWRCTVVGCNPVLKDEESMKQHRDATGHRTAKWPIRSAEGKRRAARRNRNGYYDKYNFGKTQPRWVNEHPFSEEALGQDY